MGAGVTVCVAGERPAPLESEEETTSVVCRVLEVQPVKTDTLIALACVELVIAGVALTLHVACLQVQRRHAEVTAVTLPRYRAAAGNGAQPSPCPTN